MAETPTKLLARSGRFRHPRQPDSLKNARPTFLVLFRKKYINHPKVEGKAGAIWMGYDGKRVGGDSDRDSEAPQGKRGTHMICGVGKTNPR